MKQRNSNLEKIIKFDKNKTVPNRLSQGQKYVRQSRTVPRPSPVEFPDWNEFEFCTKKKGAHGPLKKECLEYYSEK